MLDAVLERFVTQCPVAVVAHLSVQRALGGAWVDELFSAHAEQQYTDTTQHRCYQSQSRAAAASDGRANASNS